MMSKPITALVALCLSMLAGQAAAELPQPKKETTDKVGRPILKAEKATKRGAHRAGNAIERGTTKAGGAISKAGTKLGLPPAPAVRKNEADPRAPG